MAPVAGKPPACDRSPPCRVAFTLIELMVVVSVIVLLAAVLAPALSRALELVRIASCGENLRAQGISWSYYLSDNNQTFPLYYLNMHWCYGGKQPALCESPPKGYQSTPMNNFRPLNPYLQLPLRNVNKAEYFHCPSDGGIQADDLRSSTYGHSCYDWFGNSYMLNYLIMVQIDNPVTYNAPMHKVLENGVWTWYYYPFQSTMATIPASQIIVSGDIQWAYASENITACRANFHDSTNRVNLLFMDGHVYFQQMTLGTPATPEYSVQPFPVAVPPGP